MSEAIMNRVYYNIDAEQEEKYKTAIVDGKPQPVSNYRMEPPGIFLGRGSHPKIGRIKKRIYPEDVTLNLDKEAPIPCSSHYFLGVCCIFCSFSPNAVHKVSFYLKHLINDYNRIEMVLDFFTSFTPSEPAAAAVCQSASRQSAACAAAVAAERR